MKMNKCLKHQKLSRKGNKLRKRVKKKYYKKKKLFLNKKIYYISNEILKRFFV